MNIPEDATFEVRIKTPKKVLANLKGVTEAEARAAVEKARVEHADNKDLQERIESCMRAFGFCGSSGAGCECSVYASATRAKTEQKQTCPRRMDEMGPWGRRQNLDTWDRVGNDLVCSFCGSLHPDRVIELVRQHGIDIVERSTKSYKWYINRPNVPNAGFGGIKYYRMHDTPEFIAAFNELVAAAKCVPPEESENDGTRRTGMWTSKPGEEQDR